MPIFFSYLKYITDILTEASLWSLSVHDFKWTWFQHHTSKTKDVPMHIANRKIVVKRDMKCTAILKSNNAFFKLEKKKHVLSNWPLETS